MSSPFALHVVRYTLVIDEATWVAEFTLASDVDVLNRLDGESHTDCDLNTSLLLLLSDLAEQLPFCC